MNELDLQLTPTQALIDELTRRSDRIILLCRFRVSEGQSVEIARWSANEVLSLGMAADLQHRILLSMEAGRPPDRAASPSEAGPNDQAEEDDDPRH